MMTASRASIHAAAALLSVPLALALTVTNLSAQSLGDVARKTDAARSGSTSKVYTNESLPGGADTPVPSPGAAQAAGQAGAAGQPSSDTSKTPPAASAGQEATAGDTGSAAAAKTDGKTDGKTEEKGEKYWRQRIAAERDALARAQSFAEALQSRINALSNDFVNRDDPAQRNVIAADREKALVELERVRKEIAQHTQAIADIQQEARRAGVPAGWVR